jgi:hypothetical protein
MSRHSDPRHDEQCRLARPDRINVANGCLGSGAVTAGEARDPFFWHVVRCAPKPSGQGQIADSALPVALNRNECHEALARTVLSRSGMSCP